MEVASRPQGTITYDATRAVISGSCPVYSWAMVRVAEAAAKLDASGFPCTCRVELSPGGQEPELLCLEAGVPERLVPDVGLRMGELTAAINTGPGRVGVDKLAAARRVTEGSANLGDLLRLAAWYEAEHSPKVPREAEVYLEAGRMFLSGGLCRADERRATECFAKAAERGNAYAVIEQRRISRARGGDAPLSLVADVQAALEEGKLTRDQVAAIAESEAAAADVSQKRAEALALYLHIAEDDAGAKRKAARLLVDGTAPSREWRCPERLKGLATVELGAYYLASAFESMDGGADDKWQREAFDATLKAYRVRRESTKYIPQY